MDLIVGYGLLVVLAAVFSGGVYTAARWIMKRKLNDSY